MRTTRNIGTLALWAVAGGLAVLASGCIVDEGGPAAVCYPDLYVPWQVTRVVNNADVPVTCDYAGATTVSGVVGGVSTSVPCPAGLSQGTPLYFPLPATGDYKVQVQLLDGAGNPLSQLGYSTPPPSQYVDCSGNTQTPLVSLSITN